jgi:hypothetical protein
MLLQGKGLSILGERLRLYMSSLLTFPLLCAGQKMP